MHADASADAPRTRGDVRAATVRSSSLLAVAAPVVVALYLAATPGPARPVMFAVTAVMLAVAAATWRAVPRIARARARVAVQAAGLVVNLAGAAALSLMDGGIASPLGALVPVCVVFYAIMMPPRVFTVAAGFAVVAYWTVALLGGPAPAGYAVVYTLGLGGVSFLCLRHAAALAGLRRRLAEVSRVDPLTRSLNRRGFDEQLEHAVAQARRTGQPVTLILTDLDKFKLINDTWGHQAGDDVLTATARTMNNALRDTDLVGRLGGDEFGALLTGTGPDDAPAIVERLRTALETGAPASLGYATCPTEATTVEELRRLADARAYADKTTRTGRTPAQRHVEQARKHTATPTTTRVTRTERRRRSIADVGWLCVSDNLVGLLYAAGFAQLAPQRLAIAAVCAFGLVYGLAFVAAAHRLSRSPRIRLLMAIHGTLMLALTVTVPVLDGGVSSATGLGMLVPMPLIALGAQLRVALPLLALNATAYLVVGATVGAPGAWYTAMHLLGFGAVAAACAAQGRDSARRRRRLTDLSQTDALTGLLNRRGFEDRCATLLRPGRTMGLVLFDLDGFKTLNDTAGHAAGDELLRWVATTLTAHAPDGSVVGRLGGDEFVALIPAADVHAQAQRLRSALAARSPASLGIAANGTDGTDFAALYAHADTHLYAEKVVRRRGAPPRRVATPQLSARSA
ncbi:diguanylate cyclase (GGDEF)-like protein [Krasilnikovia cinnamomea]|uniref:Diguanylate cyclase (GGDEF)-like protein n=1 Tax=Krasilnikovia cinnamomea TaxID=349313 RepID=A0A4Q7ZU35_9ACTN|nr:GGDEF domain-containing protein [Krasilnikovia cinnamomea]RZU54401.1 diguanylate cyclase (GGDEF)-like protein [Krasilnikovia cinnamomea]